MPVDKTTTPVLQFQHCGNQDVRIFVTPKSLCPRV